MAKKVSEIKKQNKLKSKVNDTAIKKKSQLKGKPTKTNDGEKTKNKDAKIKTKGVKAQPDMKFDEDSLKNRVLAMLDDYKSKGGVLELENGNDEDDESNDEENSDIVNEDSDVDEELAEEESIGDQEPDEEDDDESEEGDNDESEDEDDSDEVEPKVQKRKANGKTKGKTNGDADDVEEKDKNSEEKKKREKIKFDFERNSRTIFIGNVPKDYDKKKIARLFKDCGAIETSRIRSVVPEKEKLSPKVALITNRTHPKVDSVNAFVVFKSNENDDCIKKALKMNGKQIDGHHLRVDRAQRPKAKKETLTSRKKSVFIGNLRFDLRDDDLINHFKKIGTVNYVRIVRDRSTGMGKGFGFVVFDDRASATKALSLNDTQFQGRSLRVKKTEDNTKNSAKKPKVR